MDYQYLFGPVPSRRLGVSLGVDLIPMKTCTLDCVYCECGKTSCLTVTRKEYVPIKTVIAELNDYLAGKPALDYITFAGSGEPTLNSGLDLVISYLKNNYPDYKVSLLTNGTLFSDSSVRQSVIKADLIIPSLDAATEKTFRLINRPAGSLSCAKHVDGLIKLRQEYTGEIRLEIFIVPGLNDSVEELSALKQAITRIKPDSVEVGTLDRPGTESWVKAADVTKMKDIALYLENAVLIGDFQSRNKIASFNESYNDQILTTLRRRPCTVEDMQKILNLHPAELQKYINHLLDSGKIEAVAEKRGLFLKIKQAPGDSD